MHPHPEFRRKGRRFYGRVATGTLAASLAFVVVGSSVAKLVRLAVENTGRPAITAPAASSPLTFGPRVGEANTAAPEIVRSVRFSQTSDDWADKVRDPAFWAQRRVGGASKRTASAPPSPPREWGQRNGATRQVSPWNPFDVFTGRRPGKPGDDDDEKGSNNSNGGDTYRTVCVRLCDGYFWPISFSTTDGNFDRDQKTCEKSCGGQARLYVYKNPGAEPDAMEDLKGVPYKKLKTAFLFRTKYDAECRCQAHPWEEASLDRHRLYALEPAKLKGNRQANEALIELKGKIAQADKAEAQRAKAAEAQSKGQKKKVTEEKQALAGPGAKPPVTLAAAAAAPSKLDPAFRAGKIKAGGGASELMGPPAPQAVKQVAALPPAAEVRSDAVKGAVIMRVGMRTPIPDQPRSKLPPIISRSVASDDWRRSVLMRGN